MTGYQETLTDPSYHRQVVVQTAPHIGNTGVNDEDDESTRIWVSGYVVRDPARRPVELARHRRRWRTGWRPRAWSASAASTPARSPGTCASAARCGSACPVWSAIRRRCASGCSTRPPMLGADLSAEVSTPAAYTVAAERRAPVHGGRARPRHQAQRRPAAGRARRDHARPAGHRPRSRTLLAVGAGRGVLLARPGRPGHRRPPGRAGPRGDDAADPAVRHLLRQPDPRPRARASPPTSWPTATAASTSRCSTGSPARSRSRRTTTASP